MTVNQNLKRGLTVLTIATLLLFNQSSIGQNIYKLSKGLDYSLFSSGAAGIGISIPISKKIRPFNNDDIIRFDTLLMQINSFDRIAATTYGIKAQRTSDIFLKFSPALPLSLLLDQGARSEFGTISVMYLETSLVNFGITELIKVLARRTRPYVYNKSVNHDQKMKRDARKSFFSGHTSQVAASSFLTAKILADNHPGDDFVPVYWASAALIPAITAFLRVKGGKHFPTDVIVGYVIGALVGVLVPQLHKL